MGCSCVQAIVCEPLFMCLFIAILKSMCHLQLFVSLWVHGKACVHLLNFRVKPEDKLVCKLTCMLQRLCSCVRLVMSSSDAEVETNHTRATGIRSCIPPAWTC